MFVVSCQAAHWTRIYSIAIMTPFCLRTTHSEISLLLTVVRFVVCRLLMRCIAVVNACIVTTK